MNEKLRKKILDRAIKVAEKNLISGYWKLETAQLYIKGANEQPEQYITGTKRKLWFDNMQQQQIKTQAVI